MFSRLLQIGRFFDGVRKLILNLFFFGALLALVLRQNGAVVNSFIPHRFDDGYGFTPESLNKALEMFGPCGVLVTVDCGITSCDAVQRAREQGIDVISFGIGDPDLPTPDFIVEKMAELT